ncbi:hypothetical protein G9P44_005461 [Scheffersomyces stipitis]|nr:hypothetical protein G9P44_005461 [Scheffersomyces stipitis]
MSERPRSATTDVAFNDYRIYQNYQGPIPTGTAGGADDVSTEISSKSSEYIEYFPEDGQYTAWCEENNAPIPVETIESIFEELGTIFGFQKDNVRNMLDYFNCLLDSRSCRMDCSLALLSLHADYIGGDRSNYKKWYLSSQIENVGQKKVKSEKESDWPTQDYRWKKKMQNYTNTDYIYQLALYLLIWGEANNLRFMSEYICFIYKCAIDYYYSLGELQESIAVPEFHFLDNVITPLYSYIRGQRYKIKDGKWKRNGKDHNEIIGYDDVNQFFWFGKNIEKLKFQNGSQFQRLGTLPPQNWYHRLPAIKWEQAFQKTYRETRTWLHVFTNFSRVWIIHMTMFWYYTSFNSPTLYTKNYSQLLDNKPPPQVTLAVVSLGSVISCLISLVSIVSECRYVPRRFPGSQPIFGRLICLIILTGINIAPSCYILFFIPIDVYSKRGLIIGICQFINSIFTFLYLSVESPNRLFNFILGNKHDRNPSVTFTSSFPNLKPRGQCLSVLLWVFIFAAKFTESYFFLTLSLRDPIRVLSIMEMNRCSGDIIFGNFLCRQQPRVVLGLLYLTNLILFFLDTYLWYIICNCFFSVGLTFSSGNSIFTPWRNIFSRLPERIAAKMIFASPDIKNGKAFLISQVWNSIIVSMYREHLISIEQVNRLVYQSVREADSEDNVIPPLFFVYQDDNSISMKDFFYPKGEAERRISFFAQSLATPLLDPYPTRALPSFTVLVPHYSEKIILGLKEIIKEDKDSKLSLLEYLKQLHPNDWECFVQDSKVLQQISSANPEDYDPLNLNINSSTITTKTDKETEYMKNKINDLPFYCVGFKDTTPEYTIRTRIWSSLRCQTLYRTVSGFMNYETAIKLLYRLEDKDQYMSFESPLEMEYELNQFSNRKFRLLIAMQRYQKFSGEEREAAHLLFRTYPSINVAYLEEVPREDGQLDYYSTLLDLSNPNPDNTFGCKYKIKLSGNPILGDGKSDNQNHSLIFTRGEYIQVVDANQDNYLEECLKIKSVLAEFEEMENNSASEYIPEVTDDNSNCPVAILGTREYIFSENIGILGDIAAGKEQTFGTLFSRTLAEIGGKLHYGHPDFLNSIFMTTRSGISKAQKGLHLNEDIYAGMTASSRGGRIKHCDYYQCGKGRDLGFGTILNFTTKIGSGMGEQILSREYFYMGTRLPIDRFLSFYYAHAGFHLNNLFIILSVQIFMVTIINLGALVHESILCNYNPSVPYTDIEEPIGCYNLQPVLNWINRFVLSVFICFFISFVPLLTQELIEKGYVKALARVFYHFVSLSPLFEVFVCQVFSKSLRDNLTYGEARYVATGRGFAISRVPFSTLYSRYSPVSINLGIKIFFSLLFATMTIWQFSLIWFWITIVSLCLAPFIFNPHQFEVGEFFLDYREFIHWMSRGNTSSSNNSWIHYVKSQRSRVTGVRKIARSETSIEIEDTRSARVNTILSEVVLRLFECIFLFIPYMFINSQNGVSVPARVNPLLRILCVALLPYTVNIIILLVLHPISFLSGWILQYCCPSVTSVIAGLVHFVSILGNIVAFQVLLLLEGWNLQRAACGFIFITSFHRFIFHFVITVFVSRELSLDSPNLSWWSGRWFTSGLGIHIISQPLREFIVKIFELNSFACDFVAGHCLMFSMTPFLLVPLADKWHTSMLFWLKPSKKFRRAIYSRKRTRQRQRRMVRYGFLYFVIMALLAAIFLAPLFLNHYIPNLRPRLTPPYSELFQPNHQLNNDTGENAPYYIPRAKPRPLPMRTVA